MSRSDALALQVTLELCLVALIKTNLNKNTMNTDERIKVKILKATLENSKLNYAKDALDYINILEKQLNIGFVSCSFSPKCTVVQSSTGIHCPSKPTKEINGDPVCDRCFENWKHLIK